MFRFSKKKYSGFGGCKESVHGLSMVYRVQPGTMSTITCYEPLFAVLASVRYCHVHTKAKLLTHKQLQHAYRIRYINGGNLDFKKGF